MFERYVIFYGSKALNKSLSQCPQLEKYMILKTSNKKIHKKKNQILSDSQSSVTI